MTDQKEGLIVWADCEMTGLDPEVDELVEVALFVTDYSLRLLDDGFSVVIRPGEKALANMGDFVRDMHQSSGLLDDLPNGLSLADAEEAIMEYVCRHLPSPGQAPLAGNSIATDRAFIQRYLPRLHGHLHYRNLDVSTIKELARHWYPKTFFHSPEKNGGHRARADILESIRELEYYRRVVFVEQPGPATSELRAVSHAVVEAFRSSTTEDAGL